MLRSLNGFAKKLNQTLIYIACVCLIAVIVCCIIQVLTRFVPFITITGTEELARYSFIWLIFLGGSACVGYRTHPALSLLKDLLPKRATPFFDVIAELSIIALGVVFVIYGKVAAENVSKIVSTSFQINMVYIYASAVVGGVLMTFNAINNLLQFFFGRKEEMA